MEVITQSKRTALGIIRIQPLELVNLDSCQQNETNKRGNYSNLLIMPTEVNVCTADA